MKVAIAGAGIGGLSLALCLHKRGIDCEVFEAAPDIKPLGVGINLLPHAVKELTELGLKETIARPAIETSALWYFNKFGHKIWSEPRGLAAGYEWPQFSVHRGELQMALHQAAIERIGAERVLTGHALESFDQDATGVTLKLRRNDGSPADGRADILVGADGLHSTVRRLLHPGERPLRFSGRMLWRAVTEGKPFLDGRTMFMAGHQDQKFVCYPISEPLRLQGRSCINWIAELFVGGDPPAKSDWNRRVDKAVFSASFADWRWEWIDIPAIIDAAETIYEFPLVDRDPLPFWTQGRVTLLGDAAHPMYPIGSNGSAQAILDARYLADCLAEHEPSYALREYEAERLPRTAAIVLRNRMNGPEQVMQIAEERAPQGFRSIHDVIPQAELVEIAARYKRVAGFDRDALKRS